MKNLITVGLFAASLLSINVALAGPALSKAKLYENYDVVFKACGKQTATGQTKCFFIGELQKGTNSGTGKDVTGEMTAEGVDVYNVHYEIHAYAVGLLRGKPLDLCSQWSAEPVESRSLSLLDPPTGYNNGICTL